MCVSIKKYWNCSEVVSAKRERERDNNKATEMPVNLNKNEQNVATWKLITVAVVASHLREPPFTPPLCLRGRWAATLSPRIYLGNWIYVHTQQIAINKSNKRCDKHEQIYKFALEKAEKKKHKQNTHTQTAAKSAKQTNKTVRRHEIKGERGRWGRGRGRHTHKIADKVNRSARSPPSDPNGVVIVIINSNNSNNNN